MKFHQAGKLIIYVSFVTIALTSLFYVLLLAHLWWVNVIFFTIMLALGVLIVRFFRVPTRVINKVDDGVLSPADGTIVYVGTAFEHEYFKEERLKISIFMSINNVHVNSYPITGEITYMAYHPGKYAVAKLPKSSVDNEHNTIVVRNDDVEVLFRQIAGCVARRIGCDLEPGDEAIAGEELGMIRFGSRVDVFLPLDAEVNVKMNQKTIGKETVLAILK